MLRKSAVTPEPIMDYYIAVENGHKGPYTRQQLETMWNSGDITCDALYSSEGMTEWRRVEELIRCARPGAASASNPSSAPSRTFAFEAKLRQWSRSTVIILSPACARAQAYAKLQFDRLIEYAGKRATSFRSKQAFVHGGTAERYLVRAKDLGERAWSAACGWPLRRKLIVGTSTFLLLSAISIKLFSESPLPPHVVRSTDGTPAPEAGYAWLIGKKDDLQVVWSPGLKHRQHAHVIAAAQEGEWNMEAGYSWATTNQHDMRAVWNPGMKHPKQAHVFAADQEGMWNAGYGYSFVNTNQGDFRVVWSVGALHPERPHIIASAQEGYWTAAAGYGWIEPASDLRVRWIPQVPHPDRPHVLANAKEGYWSPAPGYRFLEPENELQTRWSPGIPNYENPDVIASMKEGTWVAARKSRSSGTGWSDSDKVIAAVAVTGGAWLADRIFSGNGSSHRSSGSFGGNSSSSETKSATKCERCNGGRIYLSDGWTDSEGTYHPRTSTHVCPMCSGTGWR